MKWSEIIAILESDGYQRGTPPHTGLVDGIGIDREISEGKPCSECGGEMRYIPMIATNSYRAFARCKDCENTIEF